MSASSIVLRVNQQAATVWFVFGGDGGGELYAFALTGEQPWPVVRFDGIDPEGSVEDVAESFASFMQLLATAADSTGHSVQPWESRRSSNAALRRS